MLPIARAGLLDPRRGLVGFAGRELELTGLLAWCEDGAARGVRLVTGPGPDAGGTTSSSSGKRPAGSLKKLI